METAAQVEERYGRYILSERQSRGAPVPALGGQGGTPGAVQHDHRSQAPRTEGGVRHCWESRYHFEDYPDEAAWEEAGQPAYMKEVTSTCILPLGHTGDHEWTPDDEIVFTFAPSRLTTP